MPHVPANTLVQIFSISVSDQLEALTSSVHPDVSVLLSDFAPVFTPVDGLLPI